MTSIFVAKLDFGITNDTLKEAFQQYGEVIKASVAIDKETGKSRGFGFVEMSDREEALNAIKNLDGSSLNGRTIAVKEAEQRADNRPNRDGNNRGDFNRNRDNQQSGNSNYNRADRKAEESGSGAKSGFVDFVPPAADPLKSESRKKEKDKKPKDWDADGRAKKPKMNAYKKSGKNNRFFGDDDEDEEWDADFLNHSSDDYEDEEFDYEDEDAFEDED
jgi:RNA recognition motif-containing protein